MVKKTKRSIGGLKGGLRTKELYGTDFYIEIGNMGGETTRKKGKEFYRQIALKGWEMRRKKMLMEAELNEIRKHTNNDG